MGHFDSSATRVAPVFDQLFARDPSGVSWLGKLISLGSRAPAGVTPTLCLVDDHGARWGRNETYLPAPSSLLEHLVRTITPEQVAVSKDAPDVRQHRLALANRNPGKISEALDFLKAGKRGKKWFVLEGDSRPDALLETSDTVVVVEGKRTERSCTTTTKWMGNRSQLIRHMDAALDRWPRRQILGLLIVEGKGGAEATAPSAHWLSELEKQIEPEMLASTLPHRSEPQRDAIRAGVLGVTTWQRVCDALRLPWPPEPVLAIRPGRSPAHED